MAHDEGHVEVLVVDQVALLAQTVGPGHLPVVGREDHDRPVRLARGLQGVEHEVDAAVHVAGAVEVEVQPREPRLLVRHRSEHRLHRRRVLPDGRGGAGEVVVDRRREVQVPAPRVQGHVGGGTHDHGLGQVRRRLHDPTAAVVVAHDVVRVHEVHGQEPGLVAVDRRGPVPQPADRLAGDDRVDLQAGPRPAVQVAPVVELRESVGLERVGGRAGVRRVLVRAGQVPLALVGAVVAGRPQHRAQGAQRRVERADVGHVVVVVDLRVGHVPPGVDHRPGRAALRGRDVVPVEGDPALLEPRPRGEDEAVRARQRVPLLVAGDQQDVRGSSARP